MDWAARVYCQAIRTTRSRTRRRPSRPPQLRVECLEAREVPHVTGTVYIDQNLNGSMDPEDVGVAGVTVTAIDSTGATQTATTGADGTYTLETDAPNLRIEFSNLPNNVQPGRVTDTSGPLVRFLDANSDRTAVDLALAAPQLVTTQFNYDDAVNGANAANGSVISVPYGADSSVTPTVLANVSDVGSVWGLAYQPSSNSLFASSFLKTHAGLGPNADGTGTTTGGIYQIDPTGADVPTLLIDLNTAGTGLGTGANPHPTQPDPDGDWFHDSATVPLVGKRGLGGLAISQDGKTLYTVNLATRELVEIPLNPDGTRDTSRSIRHTPIPIGNSSDSGITNFNSADMRPFAVAVHNGAVFVGVTFTAETSGLASDLRAYVFAFDPNQGAFRPYNQADGKFSNFSVSPVLTVNLNYPRGLADDPTPDDPHSGDEVSANWKPWVSSFPTNVGQAGSPVHPSPWLTGIAFDGSNMVLGIRDRFGDQGGFQTGNMAAASEDEFSVIATGDILRAAPSGTGWQLESNGSSGGVTSTGAGDGRGPGGGQFYQDASTDPVPQEVGMGGLAQVPGFGTIAATVNDPTGAFSGGIDTFANSNAGSVSKVAGTATNRIDLFDSSDLNTFGSANGLGGLAALPADGTVQVGDRVFADTNGNGIQDAGEPGIANVELDLFQGITQVDSTTTDDTGSYTFDNLHPNTAYEIRIDTTQAALAGRNLDPAHQGTDSLTDSDATKSGTIATVAFTTGEAGSSDHSLDVGFTGKSTTPQKLTLGDRVFQDANNNGHLDAGETGVAGVTVELLDSTGTNVLSTATTDPTGTYLFTGLDPGTYRVRLAASNFTGSGPLVAFTSSTTASNNPDDNVNDDNNGRVNGPLGSGGVIQTGPVSLTVGGEPTNDGDTDPNTNLTVDFGVVPPAATTSNLSVGGTVWNDADNNGLIGTAEAGIAGATVQLLDSTGNVVQTTTTGADGKYTFGNLAAGSYKVRLPATDFTGSGPLVRFTSSTGTKGSPKGPFEGPATPSPNNGVANDKGQVTGTLGTASGFVETGTVTLATGAAPNTTVDLGLFQPVVAAATGSLSGQVILDFNNNGTVNGPDSGIPGVTLQLSGGSLASPMTVQTDSFGNFTFGDLAAGTYTLTETQPTSLANVNGKVIAGSAGGTVTASTNTIAGITLTDGKSATGYTFAEVPLVSTGGAVYEDTDGNGIKDAGEPGIPGVTVSLTGTSVVDGTITPKTTTTGSDGTFTFTNLTPGSYTITKTPPTGFTTGKNANGTPPAMTVADDKFAGIDLTSAVTSGAFNFGEVKGTSLAGFVYDDANNDGSKAATGEPGIAGVKVRLIGTNEQGHAVDQSTTTGTDGSFLFGSLRPGTYRVVETQPAGYADGKETSGTPPGNTAANDQITDIHLTSGTAATGYLFGEQARAHLKLTQSPATAFLNPGGTVMITYTLKNAGTATATAAAVAVNFGGLNFESASDPTAFNSTTKTWTVGDLAAGETKTIRLTFRGTPVGTFTPSSHATTTVTELTTAHHSSTSTISVGVPPPDVMRSSARGFLRKLTWFLSSSTNARR
jgi:hypothetical protein